MKSCKPHEKTKQKHQNAKSFGKNWKLRVWCSLFYFFHVICKISNSNMYTTKHLAQASCTELTLNEKSTIFKVWKHIPPPRGFYLLILQLLDVQTLLSVFLFYLLILEYGLQDEQAAFETKKVSFFALVISRVKWLNLNFPFFSTSSQFWIWFHA